MTAATAGEPQPPADPPAGSEAQSAASLPVSAAPAAADSEPGDGAAPAGEVDLPLPVDESPEAIASQVRQIFDLYCITCHSAERRRGGLALDTKQNAERGGDTGKAILGGPLADNELYARVSSDDRTYRMPKNGEALPAAEIEAIRRWVELGSPWHKTPAESKSSWEKWLDWVGVRIDRYQFEYNYALPYVIGFLVVQIGLLFVMRTRAACRQGASWTTGRMARWCRWCQSLHTFELLLVVLLSVSGVALAIARGHVVKLDDQLAELMGEIAGSAPGYWTSSIYGYPPKPVRLDAGTSVTRTYYRGNCERNPELFNGGNYLTAVFRVNLVDQEHYPIEVGDPVPEGGLLLRCEIERAPGTTDTLYSEELMRSVVLVDRFSDGTQPPENPPTRLETLDPGWRWVAYVPIGKAENELSGVVYMYTGYVDNEPVTGSPSYAIQYQLLFADGKLNPASDLWMDSFGNGAFAEPTPHDLLPYSEWFDSRPMPVITGPNSTDPKLLGVDEYVQKGLIKAPTDQAPADQAPTDQAPNASEPSAGDGPSDDGASQDGSAADAAPENQPADAPAQASQDADPPAAPPES